MEIFKYLIKKGAPISPAGAKFNPLFIGIRKRNLEIVSALLLIGADPNSSMLTKNNNPYYPLDVAISTGFNEAVTLLIMFGANTALVDRKRVSDASILAMLDQFRLPNQNNDDTIIDVVREIKEILSKLKSGISAFGQELKRLRGSSPTNVVKTLNSVRKLFSDLVILATNINKVSTDIDTRIRPLFQRQLEIFNQSQTIEYRGDAYFNGGRVMDEAIENEWKENRIKIANAANGVHQFIDLKSKIMSIVATLEKKTNKFIKTSVINLTNAKKEFDPTKITNAQLLRMGFSEEASEVIADNNIERINIVDETLEHLNEHKNKCDELLKLIMNEIV
jgi:hypothetical protein